MWSLVSERNFEFRVTPPRSVTLSFASVGHSPRSDTLSVASNGVALKTNFEFLVQGFTRHGCWIFLSRSVFRSACACSFPSDLIF